MLEWGFLNYRKLFLKLRFRDWIAQDNIDKSQLDAFACDAGRWVGSDQNLNNASISECIDLYRSIRKSSDAGSTPMNDLIAQIFIYALKIAREEDLARLGLWFPVLPYHLALRRRSGSGLKGRWINF